MRCALQHIGQQKNEGCPYLTPIDFRKLLPPPPIHLLPLYFMEIGLVAGVAAPRGQEGDAKIIHTEISIIILKELIMSRIDRKTNHQASDGISDELEGLSGARRQEFEVPRRIWLPIGLTFSIKMQLKLRMSEIKREEYYTLKNILGDAYWKVLSRYEQRLAYSCVDYLIKNEDLSLEPLDFDKYDYLYY